MSNTIEIRCTNTNTTQLVPKGSSLQEVANIFKVKLEHTIFGALVNNKVAEMSFEVYRPKTIEFIDITHQDGRRMYMRSLFFVLYKAVKELFPEGRLRIEHSVSKGVYCEILSTNDELNIQDIFAIGEKMREITARDLPFIRDEKETLELIGILEKQGLTDKTNVLKGRGKYYTSYYKLDHLSNLFYGYLLPSTGYLKTFDLNKYYKGMLLQVPKSNQPNEVEDLIIQSKMFDIFQEYTQWNKILNVPNIGELNASFGNGKSDTLIKVSEAFHEKKIAQIADQIANKKETTKIILISGPSSSGKTTFSKRLAIQLLVAGLKPVNLSLDNYFVNRDDTPKDKQGELDFESINALDIELFNQNLLDLLAGKAVEIPKFNFETGKRFWDGETIQMQKENLLIIEGIHGLNPQLTHSIPKEAKFKVYVSALTSLNIDDHNRVHTTDNRLIRRIVRDYRYRNYSAHQTLSRWASVRRGEETHIFPFQEEANVMFNTALLYELSVLKPFAEPILLEVAPNCKEYAEAKRLLKFFSYFKPIHPREIPPTSIIREFLGGSSFNY